MNQEEIDSLVEMAKAEIEAAEQETTAVSSRFPSVSVDDLPDSWREAMARAGWAKLMPVQSKAMPYVMANYDLMVQSRTGSGKTGAFILPILERVNPLLDACQALVLVPTRELAQQVTDEAKVLAGETGVRVTAVYGGVGYGNQLQALRQGAHIVVGTPGRLLDHLLRRSLTLDELQILVFDEADRMLSMGFYPDMKQVQRYLPQRRVGSFMFSATFPPRVLSLARQFLHEPDFMGLSTDNVHVAETTHSYIVVPPTDKDRSLVRLIEVENPDSAIIFCNTKMKVNYVRVVLQRFGYDADELSSDLSQKDRERVLQRVRDGKLRFLVATDVAARGIDIPELSHVIQYEPPEDHEVYIHRAGRTGRAGASGEAISLVDFTEKMKLKQIAKRYEMELEERPLPSHEDVARVVAERMTVLLETKLRERDKLQTERMQRFVPLARQLAESEEGLSLLAMLLDDSYQLSLHTPLPAETAAEAKRGVEAKKSGRSRRRRRSSRRS
ncbi:MAG: DEAD/DEAH box helicase [Ardenticatenaceae bacterium]|nr:DEAD/DEAH box helicase [Ardenticatenaceae bacterium]